MATHYIERDNTVHCEASDGDIMLLCKACRIEGDGMKETSASINCPGCIEVIEFCRKIRPGEIAPRFTRRRT